MHSTVFLLTGLSLGLGRSSLPDGWTTKSPRDELRPTFSVGVDGAFVIEHDSRDGLDGWFERKFPVEGGKYYRFSARRRVERVAEPRTSALVRIVWQDATGKQVHAAIPDAEAKRLGHKPTAEPEFPQDGVSDAAGWASVGGVFRAPPNTVRAIVELHLQWAPHGRIEWRGVEFKPTDPPSSRKVRLAAVHLKPSGRSGKENLEEYAPLLAEAGRQRVDLAVLGETVPYVGLNKKPAETAEPIPGPSTKRIGELAKENRLHVVLSIYERDRHLVYNTAVLIGPDGELIGKYRKVCLPHAEVESGVAPGREYPVFDTKLGKIGLMVCYDGFFPEVARELSNRGAEIIAWPVWGCNSLLAQARACENHVYLVSSTYMAPKDGWMLSAVYDQTGKPLATAETWKSLAVAEVDLSRPYIGPYNLGDFRAMVPRHRPPPLRETSGR
jgi:predicted amidohydrolase